MTEPKMDKNYPRTMYKGPGDEIVISGISGRYPNSLNLNELEHNLYNKVDMIDDDERRWRHDYPEIPKRSGKMNNLEKFDATFFGIHSKQVHSMDPQARILVEKAYEAILDAGVNPKSMRGTRTGVFIGACYSESEKKFFYENLAVGGFGITGCARAMFANRISFSLGLQGPSLLIDTACSTSFYALDAAFTSMRIGECDAALVGATNLTLNPHVALQLARLGALASDGISRPFDANASGYVRSEAISVLLLQKSRDAKRIYSTVLYSKTNCDGFKEEGITYPSSVMQAKLLSEFYKEINIQPEIVNYVEAHGTATIVGDPEECKALDEVFCRNRKSPMPIGSVKSNLGHSEAAAGMCAIAKCLLAMDNQLIPPNINFSKKNPSIKGLEDNRLQVVLNTQKLDGPLIAINGFGFGGANAHCLLRANPKVKINKGAPKDKTPRLVGWSGRTEEACNAIHEALASQPLDVEYIALLHNAQRASVSGNVFKSFGLYKHVEDNNPECIIKEVQHFSGIKRPIVYVFSGMGSQWNGMGAALLELPIFRQAIQRCHDLLKPKGLDLLNIITSPDKTMFDNILHSFVGISAIQAALYDCLAALNIQPDYIIGHSVGELGCAYADNCLTMEEMILCAYSRGMASLEAKTIKGTMAAIGLSYNKSKNLVPPTIDIACHNGPGSCTISGPQNEIEKFVTKLTADGIFAREVNVSNIAYHSRYISDMGPKLLDYLHEIIKVPKKRSAKWLSTSVPQNKWDLPESQYCSAEYQTNNLLGPVLFEEASLLLPQNAVLIEIAPHSLLQAVFRKSLSNAIYIPLTQRGNKQSLDFFLTALGRIYLNDIDIAIENLYPQVEFPVSRGTPRLSHLIKWDHSEDWFVMDFNAERAKSGEKNVLVSLHGEEYQYIEGHVIDGRCLFPTTGYLSLVWETFAGIQGKLFSELNVQFEEVKYLRETVITNQMTVEFLVMIQFGTGRFEISEGSVSVVTGFIKQLPSDVKLINLPSLGKSDHPYLPTKDFYKELRLRGYNFKGIFRDVIEARSDGLHGRVRWRSNWVAFMNCVLQILTIGKDTRSLLMPKGIEKLTIDTAKHQTFLSKFNPEKPETHFIEVFVNTNMDITQAGGIEIKGLQATPIGRRKVQSLPVLESYKFISYIPTPKMSEINSARICIQHAIENHPTPIVKCVELLDKNSLPFIIKLKEAIKDLPLHTTGDLMILSSEAIEYEDILVENSSLTSQSNCLFVIKPNCLTELVFLERSKASLLDHGYIISREAGNLDPNEIFVPQGFHLIAVMPLDNETLVMLQKKSSKISKQPVTIKISSEDKQFQWLEKLKAGIKQNGAIVYSQNDSLSGIIGLVNCVRKEPNGSNVVGVFIDDPNAPPFDPNNPFYKKQLELNFATNVYRNGQWGTFQHLAFERFVRKGPADIHAYANLTQKGDLSSLRWLKGSFSHRFADENQTSIQFAALNFRDILFATGKLPAEEFSKSRLEQECVLGFEYSGIDTKRNRIMGMGMSGAISTHIISDPGFTWSCPDNWSLEQAATVPVVYSTVYAALFLHANIKKGNSILIHAGTGGIGLAAITVSLAYGLKVFTTVSTKGKRDFLLTTYPELKESHIGNSRDTTFENMIQFETNGAGVDYVLNSLSEEKLQASLRCLGNNGKFLEIGKFDIANDTKIGLHAFKKQISFHTVSVDILFASPLQEKMVLKMLVQKDIDAGIIKPLPTTVYPANEIEAAFRYLASGRHIGKVLIKIREDPIIGLSLPIEMYPRFSCEAEASYVIVGGLGGFGLELVDWLITRGARKVVISSKRGISKPYQAYRIKIWETYGVIIKINISNVGTKSGCEALFQEAITLGPIDGIFNLAMVLQDGILENQTIEKFNQCFLPKVNGTICMDQLSRKLCPALKHFVVFSSVSCGRGNAGQTNYGMANSIMERLIEQRHQQNLPGKAIQWGPIDDVGFVADLQEDNLELKIGATLQQKISSCIEVLDYLLIGECPVVGSMVVAEKHTNSSTNADTNDVVSSIMNIMSIRDIKTISMEATLADLGMDSMMAVEIKQTLDRDFDIFVSSQNLRKTTFAGLIELKEQSKQAFENQLKLKYSIENFTDFQTILKNLRSETSCDKLVVRLATRNNSTKFKSALIIVPGIEGVLGAQWNTIVSSINLPTFSVHFTNIPHAKSIEEIVEAVSIDIHKEIGRHIDTFYIAGYSFGSTIALHLANKFEESGKKGNVILIDGSLSFVKQIFFAQLPDVSENAIEVAVCAAILKQVSLEGEVDDLQEKFLLISTWEERVNKVLQYASSQHYDNLKYLKTVIQGLSNRLKIILNSKNSEIPKIKSAITLIRPTFASIRDIDEDYGLAKFTEDQVFLKSIDGNHFTMLESPKLIEILNELQSIV